jgi:predicted AAA+ superfamily ATPase
MRAAKMGKLLDVIEGTALWRRIEPFLANLGKRIVRAPKGWIADAGLLHALLDLGGPEDLDVHPLAGMSLEGWVMQELIAQADLMDHPPAIMHWRTHAGAEVDIVLERGERLLPVEVKRSTRIGEQDTRGLRSFLNDFGRRAPFGIVLCMAEAPARLTEDVLIVPIARIA